MLILPNWRLVPGVKRCGHPVYHRLRVVKRYHDKYIFTARVLYQASKKGWAWYVDDPSSKSIQRSKVAYSTEQEAADVVDNEFCEIIDIWMALNDQEEDKKIQPLRIFNPRRMS